MFEEGKDQIILVNGASGAGKTEATKLMVRHLVWMSGRTAIVDDAGSSVTDKIQDVILSSNAAFEAFGNAFTVHNKNSSRFGKFIRLEYGTKDKAITSAHVSQFLLEKSRLVSPVNGEGNFHILYQIVQQSGDDVFHQLRLGSRDYRDFAFLRGCDDVERPPLEDTKEALEKLGYDTTAVFRILSGILHLGEIQFEAKNGDDEVAAVASAGSLLQDVAHLLDLPGNVEDAAATLQKALTVRTTVVGNALPGRRMSIQTMPMTPTQAAESRNGLAKWLYGAIFDGLFEAFNDACGSTSSNLPFIGFLDIFGFEVLAVNSFEQLCINYSNEAMQAVFNEHVFNNEVAVYKAEGVDFSEVRFDDNSDLLSLLDGKRDSVFVYLDEQTMLGKRGSDANLLSNLIRRHRSSSATPCFELPRFGTGEAFIIKHFAGDVEYNISGFVAKNNDALHADLLKLATSSSSPVIQRMLTVDVDMDAEMFSSIDKKKLKRISSHQTMTGGNKLLGKMSVSRTLRSEIASLKDTLKRSSPHFVRCVMPNNKAAPAPAWDQALVISQLRFLGITETCRIRRQGFPVRRAYSDLAEEFRELLEAMETSDDHDGGDTKESVMRLLQYVLGAQGEKGGWQLGTSRVFLRDGKIDVLSSALQRLQREREAALRTRSAQTLQAEIRRLLAAQKANRLREERRKLALEAQRRRELEEREQRKEALRKMAEVERRREAAAQKVQAHARRIFAIRLKEELLLQEQSQMAAATKLQSLHRTRSAGRSFQKKKSAAMVLQKVARGHAKRKFMSSKIGSATSIQAAWRGRMKRVRFRDVQAARAPWKPALRSNEFIIYASLVKKRAEKGMAKVSLAFSADANCCIHRKPGCSMSVRKMAVPVERLISAVTHRHQ